MPLVAVALVAACGDGEDTGASAPASAPAAVTRYPLAITDDSGIDVTIPAPPQRVIALLPSVTNLFVDLRLEDRVVAVDDFTPPASPTLADKPSVGGSLFVFNLEAAVELDPDLVVVGTGGTDEFIAQARALGWPVIAMDVPASVEVMLAQFRLLGRVFDVQDEADALAADLRRQIDAASAGAAALSPVRVYVEFDQSDPSAPFAMGPRTIYAEIVALAGGENVFAGAATSYPQVNYEAVIEADPEVILLLDSVDFADPNAFAPISVEEVGQRVGWNGIAAVRNGNVVPINQAFFTSSGFRLVEAIRSIRAALDAARETSARWATLPAEEDAA